MFDQVFQMSLVVIHHLLSAVKQNENSLTATEGHTEGLHKGGVAPESHYLLCFKGQLMGGYVGFNTQAILCHKIV